MLQVFVFTRVAVQVRRWFEIDLDDGSMEHGSRVQISLLEPQPHRGTESAAQRIVVDGAFWRADLFDKVGSPPASFDAAHFHPRFHDGEPSERHWPDELRVDPWAWLLERLGRLDELAEQAGVPVGDVAEDVPDVRAFAPQIVAAARQFSPERGLTRDDDVALTRDVHGVVRLMVANMKDPGLLDAEHVGPWLGTGP